MVTRTLLNECHYPVGNVTKGAAGSLIAARWHEES